jgi:hypothetical protein
MNQIICRANSLQELITEVESYIATEEYFVVTNSFQVLTSEKIGGKQSEFLCIIQRMEISLPNVLKQLDHDDIVQEGDLRCEEHTVVEVPSIQIGEQVGCETIFRPFKGRS